MHRIKGLVGLCFGILLITISLHCHAQASPEDFNPEQANKTLDALSLKLSSTDLTVKKLEDAISELTILQEKANDCVEDADKEIAKLKVKLVEAKASESDPEKQSLDVKYLKDKESTVNQQRSACSLFLLRANEAVAAYSKTIHDKQKSQRFQVYPTLWQNFKESPQLIRNFDQHFSTEKFLKTIGYEYFTELHIIILMFIISIVWPIGQYYKSMLAEFLSRDRGKQLKHRITHSLLTVLHRYYHRFFILLFVTVFFGMHRLFYGTPAYFLELSVGIFLYYNLRMLISLFLTPPEPEDRFEFISENIAKPLAFRLKLLLNFIFITFIFYLSCRGQVFPDSSLMLMRTLFMTALATILISIVWLINRSTTFLEEHRGLRIGVSLVLALGLFVIIGIEWLGYHGLTDFVILGLAQTVALSLVAIALHKITMHASEGITSSDSSWHQHIRYYLGLRKKAPLPELVWLHLGLFILIWGTYALFFIRIWGLIGTNYISLYYGIFNGIQITGVTIYPARIVAAIFIFVAIALFTRSVRTRIARKTGSLLGGRGVHNSLAAIAGYVGYTFAVIFSMLVAGVNFAGLAIIAGALSVGIGFGLQNIVNNFVSGLVLLIERPIRVGDRIIVGNVEGHVRDINIRATIIRTRNRTDVIVPNSELVTGQVDNLMYGDAVKRLQIYIGVAYGSDTELVRDTLLEVAKQHPDVLNNEEVQPLALFNEFADSSLTFELRVVIRDVDRQQHVRSELHFAVDKAFRERKIEIAFPQRDITIKNWPPSGSLPSS